MNDIDDTQIKAEIDGIMQGVKDIMKKIDAVTPKEEPQTDTAVDESENQDSSNASPAQDE